MGSSRYYGVCRHKYGVRKKWVAKCGSKYIGYYITELEAATAVDRKLDEMDIDRRFRNIGGCEAALQIMKKVTGKPSNWRRSAATKLKLGEYEELDVEISKQLITSGAKEMNAQQDFQKLLKFDAADHNVNKNLETPLQISSSLQIEPELPHFPKLELHSLNDPKFDINKPRFLTTVAINGNSHESMRHIDSAEFERYSPVNQQQFSAMPCNLQGQLVLDQPASHMANPVTILLLWKSKGFISVKEYVTAVRMLDGRYGEVNAWSTRGLLDMGDVDTLKATLKEAE